MDWAVVRWLRARRPISRKKRARARDEALTKEKLMVVACSLLGWRSCCGNDGFEWWVGIVCCVL
jgi:hypothetical protein